MANFVAPVHVDATNGLGVVARTQVLCSLRGPATTGPLTAMLEVAADENDVEADRVCVEALETGSGCVALFGHHIG